jgi:hypothetical protein
LDATSDPFFVSAREIVPGRSMARNAVGTA